MESANERSFQRIMRINSRNSGLKSGGLFSLCRTHVNNVLRMILDFISPNMPVYASGSNGPEVPATARPFHYAQT